MEMEKLVVHVTFCGFIARLLKLGRFDLFDGWGVRISNGWRLLLLIDWFSCFGNVLRMKYVNMFRLLLLNYVFLSSELD